MTDFFLFPGHVRQSSVFRHLDSVKVSKRRNCVPQNFVESFSDIVSSSSLLLWRNRVFLVSFSLFTLLRTLSTLDHVSRKYRIHLSRWLWTTNNFCTQQTVKIIFGPGIAIALLLCYLGFFVATFFWFIHWISNRK